MKNFIRKQKTLLCVASLLSMSMFASCSKDNSETTVLSNNNKNNASTTATTTTSTAPTEIVIYTHAVGQATTPSNDADVKMVADYIAEKIGVFPKMIIAPKGSETEKLNLLLSSNERIDLFKEGWPEYKSRKAIVPINDVIDKFGKDVKAAWPQEAWQAMTDKDGTIWGVAGGTPTTPYPLYVREDWLKAVSMEQPKNFDELEAVLKAFKEKDFAGNGTTIPMITSLRGIRNNLSGGYTGEAYGNWLDPSDNKVKPMELNPEYKEFIKRMAQWYKDGYIFKESFAGNVIRDMIKQNKVGVHAEWYSNVTFSEPILQVNVPEAHYLITPLEGPGSKISETVNKGGQFGTLISAKCKDIEAAMKFINFAYEDMENFIIMKDGIEGVHWKYKNKELKINEPINLDKITYYGELAYIPLGMPIEQRLNTELPEQKLHYEYIRNNALAFDRTLKPFDFTVFYDNVKIKQVFPNVTDITTMLEQQTIAFITGTRPIDDYDKFIKELYSAGLDKWIEAYTTQYNELNK